MVVSLIKRYGLVITTAAYTGVLILLHALGRFPAPGAYDLSRLAGSPLLTFEGRVINFPMTRWRQTRFLMEGRADPMSAFHGRALVNLAFPIEDLAPGEWLRVRGWLSRPRPPSARRVFDERAYLAGERTFAVLKVWSRDACTRQTDTGRASWAKRAWRFHQRFKEFWFDRLPPEEAALLSCVTMGSRGVLPAEIKNQCIRAGVYHILVVSGQNVAMIIALGIGCLRLLAIPRRWTFWICCWPIVFYTYAVGADPPVTRAATMAVLILAAMSMGRDIPRFVPFVLAWFWILLRQPEMLFGASFQLSFGATASLLAFLPIIKPLTHLRHRFLRWLAEAGSVSLAVHAGVWPILAYYFHQLSLAGFLANWTLFPLSGLLMVLGLVLGVWGVCAPETVPEVCLTGIHWILEKTLAMIRVMSDWTWAAVPVPAVSWTVIGVYYAVLICILWNLHYGKKSVALSQSRGRL